jgi:hypothetical protein
MLIAGRSSQDCTLLREPRRALQARIAETLESQFAETAESQPEILARHCTEAGLIEKAAGLWSIAGQRSQARSALVEAVAQFTRALAGHDRRRTAGDRCRARRGASPASGGGTAATVPSPARDIWDGSRSSVCRRVISHHPADHVHMRVFSHEFRPIRPASILSRTFFPGSLSIRQCWSRELFVSRFRYYYVLRLLPVHHFPLRFRL